MDIDKLFIIFLTRIVILARNKADLLGVDKVPIFVLLIIVCVKSLFAQITEIIRGVV